MRIRDWSSDVCATDRGFPCGVGLGTTNIGGCEQHLPLQVGKVDRVIVDDGQLAHTRCGEILDRRIADAARANDGDMAFQQSALARAPDFLEHNMTRSEEHTSELQSLMRISYAVFCLKQKKHTTSNKSYHI